MELVVVVVVVVVGGGAGGGGGGPQSLPSLFFISVTLLSPLPGIRGWK